MVFGKIIKIMLLIIVIFVIYTREHYYLILIGGIIFLTYKFNLHNKIFKLLNKITGNTKNVVQDRNRKSKYLRKLSRNGSGEI